jgi:phosphoglucomutase
MKISPLAGKPAPSSILINVPQLIDAYYSKIPDPHVITERVTFGTSGHRGSSFESSFNERHILAISQAICLYREKAKITGPLFIGADTHALSEPALKTAVEVLIANGVSVILSEKDEFTPTPVISHAILTYNRSNPKDKADGIVITPSHNPPSEGGFKYNPPNGGPAEPSITNWIEAKANEFLANQAGIKKIPFEQAVSKTKRHNYLKAYVADLKHVIDMDIIRESKIHLGVDPLGGAGVHYWQAIADLYGLNLTVVSTVVDPTFSFMTVDWDGKIRMDPSSTYAMQRLIAMKDTFDVSFGCDTDHDRHGIVTKRGLLTPYEFQPAAIDYLFKNRKGWNQQAKVGKTLVSTQMIDRVAKKINKQVYEVPVGFKWFVDGLYDGSLGFGGEESAGASFLRLDGTVWTTDKDGIIPSLLAAEITARKGQDPGEIFQTLTKELGTPYYHRIDAVATLEQKEKLKKLSPSEVTTKQLAGEKIEQILSNAPGNGAPIGGIKVIAKNGWFAARPSGTEEIYKIYAESFLSQDHLEKITAEAQTLVNEAIQ